MSKLTHLSPGAVHVVEAVVMLTVVTQQLSPLFYV